jgi:hypothetical protein
VARYLAIALEVRKRLGINQSFHAISHTVRAMNAAPLNVRMTVAYSRAFRSVAAEAFARYSACLQGNAEGHRAELFP